MRAVIEAGFEIQLLVAILPFPVGFPGWLSHVAGHADLNAVGAGTVTGGRIFGRIVVVDVEAVGILATVCGEVFIGDDLSTRCRVGPWCKL